MNEHDLTHLAHAYADAQFALNPKTGTPALPPARVEYLRGRFSILEQLEFRLPVKQRAHFTRTAELRLRLLRSGGIR